MQGEQIHSWIRAALIVGVIGVLAGCTRSAYNSNPYTTSNSTGHVPQGASVYQGSDNARLRQHYHAWQGTPHKLGGMSKRGIDCSGFVYVTFRDVYGVQLPRTADKQASLGEKVPLRQAQVGDLLVFKTGFKQDHVGIYVGDGKFIHASSSRGVMTSSVHSEYWADAYRQTRRVFF